MSSAVPLSQHSVAPLRASRGAGTDVRGPRRSGRQYKCGYCPKLFKRSEHCVRHERSHTNEKPYACQYCHKCYSRKDLVTRHERTLHADVAGKVTGDHSDDDASSEATPSERDENGLHLGHSPSHLSRGGRSPIGPRQRRESCTSTLVPASTIIAAHSQDVMMKGTTLIEDVEADTSVSRVTGDNSINRLATSFDTDLQGQLRQSDQYAMSHSNQHPHQTAVPLEQLGATEHQLLPGDLDTTMTDPDFRSMTSLPNGILDFGPGLGYLDPPNWLDLSFPMNVSFGEATPTANHAMRQTTATDASPNSTACASDVATTESESPIAPDRSPSFLAQPNKKRSSAKFLMDKSMYDSFHDELSGHVSDQDPKSIPTFKMCRTFLPSYVECYHCHLPLLHLPSLFQDRIPDALVLAMCSIGALYRLDRRRARRFYDMAVRIVDPVLAGDFPLWAVQAKFLLTFYATFSGNKDLVSSPLDESGFYTLIYSRVRSRINEDSRDLVDMTWKDWVQLESWKRLLGGIYIAGTVRTVIYGINPVFNATTDLEIEHLHEESLWNAQSADEWFELRPNYVHQERYTTRNMLEDILSGQSVHAKPAMCQISNLSILVVVHAVLVHMWQIRQLSQLCPSLSFTSDSDRSPLGHSILKTALVCLERCHDLLRQTQHEPLEDADDEAITSPGFSSHAILRAAYIRLFDTTTSFDRLSLMTEDTTKIKTSVAAFATTKLKRNGLLLDAVEKTLEGLQLSVNMGHMLVRKTAAFRWSVEQAIAAWDAGLFVTKWVHSVEIDALNGIESSSEENDLIMAMKDVLEETDYDPDESRSFAAGLARIWSLFLQDVWVWGITVRMGRVLEHLATAYELDNEANRHRR